MIAALVVGSLIVILCVAFSQVVTRFGMPALLIFLILGLLVGSVGPWGEITFTDYHFAETVCSIALVFIIFYGGFGTNWKTARPVVVESVLFSTVGVLITAGAVMLFVHLAFGLGWAESFLIGSVVSCIDAASIFSILRNQKLSLRYNTASVLEIEGGCNDLPAYMLTVVAIIILMGQDAGDVFINVVLQLVVGVGVGVVIALVTAWILKRVGYRLLDGMNLLFVMAVAMLSYSLAQQFGGNGYLSAYLCGIILGNSRIPNRTQVVHFFDTIDWVAQIIIFSLLGLMAIPEHLPAMIVPAIALTAFLTLVARPLSVFAIFSWFKHDGRRNPIAKGLFISWAGIRGAASIVFVFLALASGVPLQSDIFSLIFIVAVLSISIQGTLFPHVAERLGIVDHEGDYTLSFNDFQEQSESSFFKVHVSEGHNWANRPIRDITLGQNMLIVLIKRGDKTVTPKGDTVINPGDLLVVSGEPFQGDTDTQITQMPVDADNPWANRLIKDLELPSNTLIVSIVREDGTAITPKGWIKIMPHDTLTLFTWR